MRSSMIVPAGLVLALACPLFGDQEISAWTPRQVEQESLTLVEAVRLTLEEQPGIRLADESIRLQEAVLLEQRGFFDPVFGGGLQLSYNESEIPEAGLKAERERRAQEREVVERTGAEADALEILLEEVRNRDWDDFNLNSDDPDAQEIENAIDLFNALLLAASDEEKLRIQAIRDEYIQQQITEMETTLALIRKEEADAIERMRKLGQVPSLQEDFFGQLDASVFIPFRSGLRLSPFYRFTGEGTRYVGKKNNRDFGGFGLDDLYRSEVGFTVDLPVGRGSGWESVAAFETAAEIDLEASRAAWEHAASASVLQTLLAYWDVVAAEERLVVSRTSVELQERLGGLTRALIEGDELPRSEMPRVVASEGASRSALIAGEQSVEQARVRLAEVIGLEVRDLSDAPSAADGFPEIPEEGELQALDPRELGGRAIASRRDLDAARHLEESRGVLLRAAKRDLRPLIDLSGRVSYGGVAESNSVTGGFTRTVGDWTGPSVDLGVRFERPIGNRLWKGRYEQQIALMEQRAILRADLERTIRAGVVEIVEALDLSAERARLADLAVTAYRQSLEGEIERFQLGESTLIDTIITEQRLTDATFALVDARYLYAVLLSRLLYETGSIIESDGNSLAIREQALIDIPGEMAD